jgi:hypothetical protein
MPATKIQALGKNEIVLSLKNAKNSEMSLTSPSPKGGWWRVVWVRKPRGQDKVLTSHMSKKEAEKMSRFLNSWPPDMLLKTVQAVGYYISDHTRKSERRVALENLRKRFGSTGCRVSINPRPR